MSDIVESLEHQLDEFDSGKAIHFDYSGLRALIAEIRCLREENAALRARLEKAREVLRPFAEPVMKNYPPDWSYWSALDDALAKNILELYDHIKMGDLRRAAAWVKEDTTNDT